MTESRDEDALLAELQAAHKQLEADLDAMNRIFKIGSLYLHEGNIKSVLAEIVEAAIAVTGADFGNIQLLDRNSGDLVIMAYRGFPQWWLDFWESVTKGHGACGTALERRERVIIDDVEHDPVFVGSPALKIQLEAGVRAVQSTPLIGRTGAPIGMVSTHFRTPHRPTERALRMLDIVARQAADIIERMQAEDALRNSEKRLRALVERLQDADRHKTEFLSMLSHELRNPLTPILNSIEILERATPGSADATHALVVVRRQVEHLTHLIQDLLDVTRISSGKIALQREVLDLNELVQRTVADHREAFTRGNVELAINPAPAAVWANCDRTRLAQVVGNLLSNALKFTPAGGKTTVSVLTGAKEVNIRVQDTGRGISAEMLPRLFQPFMQAEMPLDRKQGGLGLGLAICKSLAELHGGSATAASEGTGCGTTIVITLPIAAAPAVAERREEVTEQRPRRVLVIEDNRDAAETLRAVLEFRGHEVAIAGSGPEGIERAGATHPDVVLCDIGLPTMNGYEVARAMRANPDLQDIALVAVSGYGRPQDIEMAKEAGFDAHVTKPIGLQALDRAVATSHPARDREAGV